MNLRHPAYVIGFMVLSAALFGAAVVSLRLATQPILARNEGLLRQKALVTVFGLGDPDTLSRKQLDALVAARIDETQKVRDPETGWEAPLIRAYADDQHNQLLGYAFRFRGLGFWAAIEGLLAVTADRQKTLGLVILSHNETPGLGARIAEPIFTANFAHGLNITPGGPGGKILVLTTTPPEKGSPSYGRDLNAITGATQTCFAMERILNDTLACFQRAMDAGPAPVSPAGKGVL